MYLGWFLVIRVVTVIKIVRAFRVSQVVRVVTGITVVKDLNLVISIVTVQLFDYLVV